jgi:hypothetical protein
MEGKMADRGDVIECLRNLRDEIVQLAEGAPEVAWSAATHEEGWNARQLLSHIASTSGVASFVLSLAQVAGSAAGRGGSFDIDAFNSQQVAMRENKTVSEVLDEVRSNLQRDIQAIEGAPEELLQKHFRAPWDVEGPVAQVISDSVNGHLGGHVADLRGALAG